jgi:hypothetical protein
MGRNDKGIIDFEGFVAFIRAANTTVSNKQRAKSTSPAAAEGATGGGGGGGNKNAGNAGNAP